MLGFKSFETAAVTLAGIELAHRIRKRQFSFGSGQPPRHTSLKQLWDRALVRSYSIELPKYQTPPARPQMHQNSPVKTRTKIESRELKALRSARKIFDGRGLHLLVMPNGGRYWRYNYRFDGKYKTLALGVYPDVPLAKARARHQEARSQLADGIDPSIRKRALKSTLGKRSGPVEG